MFVIKSNSRDALISYLQQKGINALIHYPVPVSRQKAFPHHKEEVFAVTEDLASRVLSIPIFPEITDEETEYIISALNEYKE